MNVISVRLLDNELFYYGIFRTFMEDSTCLTA